MSLKLAARLVTLIPHKIADLQENDTDPHDLDLSSTLPKGTKAILVRAYRISGTGYFRVRPLGSAEANFNIDENSIGAIALVPIKNRTLTWYNTMANDDWDLKLYGYFVQKRTR